LSTLHLRQIFSQTIFVFVHYTLGAKEEDGYYYMLIDGECSIFKNGKVPLLDSQLLSDMLMLVSHLFLTQTNP